MPYVCFVFPLPVVRESSCAVRTNRHSRQVAAGRGGYHAAGTVWTVLWVSRAVGRMHLGSCAAEALDQTLERRQDMPGRGWRTPAES